MKKQILVLGGTGKTGRKVAQKLTEKGHSVRIGSRSAEPAFDWNQSDNWGAVLEGMDAVYITYQPDLAVPGALEAVQKLVQIALEKGVKKAVLLSGKGEIEAERSEQMLMTSGIDWTIVRATWFSQNFSESFLLEPLLTGVVALPSPNAKIPYLHTDDISEVAVEALIDEKHNGQLYELTGPRYLTFPEVVDEIAKASGRTIQFQTISHEEYEAYLKSLGLPETYVWLITYLFREVLANQSNSVITNDVEKVLGRKAKDFSEFVKETAPTGIWNKTVQTA